MARRDVAAVEKRMDNRRNVRRMNTQRTWREQTSHDREIIQELVPIRGRTGPNRKRSATEPCANWQGTTSPPARSGSRSIGTPMPRDDRETSPGEPSGRTSAMPASMYDGITRGFSARTPPRSTRRARSRRGDPTSWLAQSQQGKTKLGKSC